MNEISLSKINEVIKEPIDLFICCSSFEERCLTIPEKIEKAKILKSLVCYNSDQEGKIIENKDVLLTLLPGSQQVALHSNDPAILTNNLTVALLNSLAKGKEAKIFIDITTFTHEALLILLKLCRTISPSSAINTGYVGAKEYSFNVEKDTEKWLTKGVMDVRSVIGYSGYFDFTKKTHLIVLFGFEIERTVKIIESFEADVVSIGLGTENYSISNDHYKINIERHKHLKEIYPYIQNFEVSLKNPFETKDQILKQFSLYSDYNKIISPLNTKISAVGAALAHEKDNDIQICYAKGILYNKDGYAKTSDRLWIYQV